MKTIAAIVNDSMIRAITEYCEVSNTSISQLIKKAVLKELGLDEAFGSKRNERSIEQTRREKTVEGIVVRA